MKALTKKNLPVGAEWLYEVKFDGFRALAIKEHQQCSLWSRTRKSLTARYPAIAEALAELPAQTTVIDGEIVALDPEGRSSFQLLQKLSSPDRDEPPLFFYAFDMLHLDGHDLTGLPLIERKQILRQLLESAPDVLRFSPGIDAEPGALLDEMKKRGLEGIIAKRRDCRYQAGKRTGAWVKFKWTNQQEFVIGGFTPPSGARQYFGALLVGFHKDGELVFASKVGSGYTDQALRKLYTAFQPLIRKRCPFDKITPASRSVPWGGLTRAELNKCTWLKPVLVCQVRFTEWTGGGHLRHPVFLGLREDKKASEVIREPSAE